MTDPNWKKIGTFWRRIRTSPGVSQYVVMRGAGFYIVTASEPNGSELGVKVASTVVEGDWFEQVDGPTLDAKLVTYPIKAGDTVTRRHYDGGTAKVRAAYDDYLWLSTTDRAAAGFIGHKDDYRKVVN